MNQTWQGSTTSKTTASTNTKAMKNISVGVTNLIENRPGHYFASKMAVED